MNINWTPRAQGALYTPGDGTTFTLWAPTRKRVSLKIVEPVARLLEMTRDDRGYFTLYDPAIKPGDLYYYVLDGDERRPDPASMSQPRGVHGPSEVIDHHAFKWTDAAWRNHRLSDYIIYELHIGTFTPEGTFDAAIGKIPHLIDLGITAVEIMPVAEFPGNRNWGYDGVYPYAVHSGYGGADALKRFVDALHAAGIAVVLDVVYNHLGPEGNYLSRFAPYLTDKYKTPWGQAINYDGPGSDHVRAYFINNALCWFRHFHIDALRLDAVHGIFDFSANHILKHLKTACLEMEREVYVIAESDLNDSRLIDPVESGGYGLDAAWLDDFHHCLHTLSTGEDKGYYADFGTIDQLASAMSEGHVYKGHYSRFRDRTHGNSTAHLAPRKMIVFSQNHDQVGNRARGNRLSTQLEAPALRTLASIVMLSPYIPLIFMGEEYAEKAPFQYFISHTDEDLIEAVRRGRMEEFIELLMDRQVPEPHAEETFMRSKLNWAITGTGMHQSMLKFYKKLIAMRKSLVSIASGRDNIEVRHCGSPRAIEVEIHHAMERIIQVANFGPGKYNMTVPEGLWEALFDSEGVIEGNSIEGNLEIGEHRFALIRKV